MKWRRHVLIPAAALLLAAGLTVAAGRALRSSPGSPLMIGPSAAPPSVAGPAVVTPPDITFAAHDVGLGGPGQVPAPSGMPVRIEVSWWGVQHEAGDAYDWAEEDARIDAAARAGMKILMLITYAPPWSSGDHDSDKWFPLPRFDKDWAAFVDAAVRRYGSRVKAYEIWNEPNSDAFGNYGDGTDRARLQRYWDLVRLTSRTVKAACPACVTLAGGSAAGTRPDNQPAATGANPNSPAAWLDWAYRHGYGKDFDAVAAHPYPIWTRGAGPGEASCGRPDLVLFGPAYQSGRPWQKQCGQMAALRAVLVTHGDSGKKIWGTEWGYPSSSGVSLERIRDFDVQGMSMWRGLPYAGPLFLYAFKDNCTDADDPECHYGIVDTAGRPKEPVYSDLFAAVSGRVPDHLAAGESLRRWSSLRSTNGRYTLTMQGNGDLVLHDATLGRTIWSLTGKGGRRWVNQPDGNLVLYRNADRPVPVWDTHTSGIGPTTLTMQNDGNLVLARDDGSVPVWASQAAG